MLPFSWFNTVHACTSIQQDYRRLLDNQSLYSHLKLSFDLRTPNSHLKILLDQRRLGDQSQSLLFYYKLPIGDNNSGDRSLQITFYSELYIPFSIGVQLSV